jgi:uncharacterized ion transporter superfamily protein YfcC
MESKKKWFPSPYTIVFCLTILAAILTHVLPSGHYDYKVEGTETIIKAPDVDSYSGDGKLVPIPGTYTHTQGNPQGITDVFLAPIKGIANAIDIISFVLMIGTYITIVMKTGAIDAGIGRVIKKLNGKEPIMIFVLILLFSLGGTVEGMQEETVAFYPVLIPILVRAGYDPILAIAVVLVSAVMGIGSSIVNPFATGIAAKFAGVSIANGMLLRIITHIVLIILATYFIVRYSRKLKKNIKNSYSFDSVAHFQSEVGDANHLPEFTWQHKVILTLFAIAIIVMIYGIIPFSQFGHPELEWGWWFTEMAALFFTVSIITAIIARMKERDFIKYFQDGLSDFIPVGFIIGLSRGIMIVLNEGKINDTLLNTFSNALAGMPPYLFIVLVYVLFIILSFIITSTSALATLTMPILAPLALMLHVPASLLISAYLFGQATVFIINPADPILNAALTMGRVPYPQWVKFISPFIVMLIIAAIVILVLGNTFVTV